MVRKGLFDWLTTVKLDDFRVLSATSKDLSCMLGLVDCAIWLDTFLPGQESHLVAQYLMISDFRGAFLIEFTFKGTLFSFLINGCFTFSTFMFD